MDELFKNDEFAQFVLKNYFSGQKMTDDTELEKVGSSIEEFSIAMDCFKLNAGAISKH